MSEEENGITDPNLHRLLESWNMEMLYKPLLDNGIDVHVLKIVEIMHLSEVLSNFPICIQIQFENHFTEWRAKIGLPLLWPPNHPTELPAQVTTSNKSTNNIDARVQKPKRKRRQLTPNLQRILKTSNGTILVKLYEKSGHFTDKQRQFLIDVIAKYIKRHKVPIRLRYIRDLEAQILKQFPTEKQVFYRVNHRGRISTKVVSLRRNKGKVQPSSNPIDIFKIRKSVFAARKALRGSDLSLEEFDALWSQCFPLRCRQIYLSASLKQVLELWPQYRLNLIHLIDIDFEIKYPGHSIFIERWMQNQEKILTMMTTTFSHNKIIQLLVAAHKRDDGTENSNDLVLMWTIHLLFPYKTIKNRKFTSLDSQNSFIICGNTIEDLNEKLAERKAKKEQLSPCLMLVGDLETTEEIYVLFNENRYRMDTALKALDLCFKIFCVFEQRYPVESTSFWTFIEHFYYKLHINRLSAKVSTICNHLEFAEDTQQLIES